MSGGALVYEATNRVTMKRYIGVTRRSLACRQMQHIRESAADRSNSRLHKALRKYGPVCFTWKVRARFRTPQEALIAERLLIAIERPEYNTTAGGEGCVGLRHTDEARAKMSETRKGRTHTPEAREKIAAAKRFKPRSAEVRAAMRAGIARANAERAAGLRPPRRSRWGLK